MAIVRVVVQPKTMTELVAPVQVAVLAEAAVQEAEVEQVLEAGMAQAPVVALGQE